MSRPTGNNYDSNESAWSYIRSLFNTKGNGVNRPKFRTKTMPGRFGLAHYQDGGEVSTIRRIETPREEAELFVDNGDSVIYRYAIPRNGSFTYVKQKGDKSWRGN